MNLKYKRVLLKLSGESLMGEQEFGIDNNVLEFFSEEIQKAYKTGVELGIVIGGGNIYRGLSATSQGIDRATGDQMGMLATVINALALQNAIEKRGIYHSPDECYKYGSNCRALYSKKSNKTS